MSNTFIISKEQLENVINCPKDSVPFDLNGYNTIGYCIDVYDGDTCKVIFTNPDNNTSFYKWTIRMMGYDAPELRGDTKPNGIIVRDLLRDKILNKCVFINCLGFDKYGRLLANLYEIDVNECIVKQDTSINEFILKQTAEYGTYPYFGGTKQ